MSNAAASSDPQYFTELTQTMPSLEKYLVHTTPSQMAAVYWDAPSFVPRNSTTRNPANVELPLVGDLPLDFSDRESPWSGPESSFPLALHAQLTPEGPGCFQGIELSYCDPFPPATHQQLVLPALQPIGPRPLDYDSGTAPVTPGIVMEQPPAPHTAIPPAPSPDPSANRPAEYTENLWQFLGVRGRQYECLRDDGSKGVCGYLGSLAKIKRHVRDSHNSKRSTVCSVCKKTFSCQYSLKLHNNQHTGETPYKCKDCETGFKNPNSLRNHRISYHGYIPKNRATTYN